MVWTLFTLFHDPIINLNDQIIIIIIHLILMDSNLGRIQSVPTLIAIVIELQNVVSVLLESESNEP